MYDAHTTSKPSSFEVGTSSSPGIGSSSRAARARISPVSSWALKVGTEPKDTSIWPPISAVSFSLPLSKGTTLRSVPVSSSNCNAMMWSSPVRPSTPTVS